jgi:excisionase family DNA binding protein
MSETANKPDSRLLVAITTDELEHIVQRAVVSALRSAPRDDKLLTVEQVCEVLNVNEGWVYHHARRLPFVRKVGGQLRFSSNGLQRYIESAKFTVADSAKKDS